VHGLKLLQKVHPAPMQSLRMYFIGIAEQLPYPHPSITTQPALPVSPQCLWHNSALQYGYQVPRSVTQKQSRRNKR